MKLSSCYQVILILLISLFYPTPEVLLQEREKSALEAYINNDNTNYSYELLSESKLDNNLLLEYSITTQTWRGIEWSHRLLILWPSSIKHSQNILIYIGSSKDCRKELPLVSKIVENSNIPAAILGSVPNQPLFEGKKENALIAYSLHKYLESGDESWPILFPMVKSVVRAMDAIEKISASKFGKPTTNYIASGASKRGWTAWLVGGVDKRVIGIAPIVFDMLNMKVQTSWAAKHYGAQSEKIKDFTDLGLVDRIEEPRSKLMRSWIDPYEIKDTLKMPKLIMLGTNDPYWVVDAQQHYIHQLPGSTLIFQEPNGDHHITSSPNLVRTFSSWLKLVASADKLPTISWSITPDQNGNYKLNIKSDIPVEEWRLWNADSRTRDFRDANWNILQDVNGNSELKEVEYKLNIPNNGFRAFLAELVIAQETYRYSLSSEAFVLPK